MLNNLAAKKAYISGRGVMPSKKICTKKKEGNSQLCSCSSRPCCPFGPHKSNIISEGGKRIPQPPMEKGGERKKKGKERARFFALRRRRRRFRLSAGSAPIPTPRHRRHEWRGGRSFASGGGGGGEGRRAALSGGEKRGGDDGCGFPC